MKSQKWDRKAILAFSLALGLMPQKGMAQGFSGDGLIVPGVRIGEADLEPADQGALRRDLGEADEDHEQGSHEYYRYGVETGNALVVDFDLGKDAPFEISTTSPAYRTAGGLRVGSTGGEIRAKLGRPLCESRAGDESLMVYGGIWFLLSGGKITKVSIRRHLDAGDFQTGPLHC